MTSSEPRGRGVDSAPAISHSRFIPGEELGRYAAWSPNVFKAGAGPANADFEALSTGLAKFNAQALSIRQPDGGLPGDNDFALVAAHTAAGGTARPGDLSGPGPAANANANAPESMAAPRDAQSAWRDAVRDELQDELLAEWAERADQSEAQHQAQLQEARQSGYQDGYRDGLVALDSFKQSYAQQVTTQVGQLVITLDKDLQQLEKALAESVARAATTLARRVVRSELTQRPELVVQVAQEAVAALVKNARHVSIALHPDDHALVSEACTDLLASTAIRLLPRSDVARGGCLVESDLGTVDALIGTRWAEGARTLGSAQAWDDAEPEAGGDAAGLGDTGTPVEAEAEAAADALAPAESEVDAADAGAAAGPAGTQAGADADADKPDAEPEADRP